MSQITNAVFFGSQFAVLAVTERPSVVCVRERQVSCTRPSAAKTGTEKTMTAIATSRVGSDFIARLSLSEEFREKARAKTGRSKPGMAGMRFNAVYSFSRLGLPVGRLTD